MKKCVKKIPSLFSLPSGKMQAEWYMTGIYSPDCSGSMISSIFCVVLGHNLRMIRRKLVSLKQLLSFDVMFIEVLTKANRVVRNSTVLSPLTGMFILINR